MVSSRRRDWNDFFQTRTVHIGSNLASLYAAGHCFLRSDAFTTTRTATAATNALWKIA
jgi:hypothetical protein